MTDDLELRLRDSLASARLPSAPSSLSATLAELAFEAEERPRTPHGWAFFAIPTMAVLVLGLVVIVLPLGSGGAPSNPARLTPEPAPSVSPSPSPSPEAVDGLHVDEVGELKTAMAGPNRPTGSIALRGFWTNRAIGHSCAAPQSQPGELEIYCHDGEFGITELSEPIITILRGGEVVPANGPTLTPWVPESLQRALFVLPIVNDQPYPPVPIVVRGHIDDPRAAECRPDARQTCLDRFVVEAIVSFDPSSVPPPTPTPVPSPFPFEDPPPAPFAVSDCDGDTEYEFVGWKTMGELGIDLAGPNEILFVVITKHVIEIGGWTDDPEGSGRRFRTMAQRVCYAYEWEEGSIGFTWMPGTAYREWDDGSRTPYER